MILQNISSKNFQKEKEITVEALWIEGHQTINQQEMGLKIFRHRMSQKIALFLKKLLEDMSTKTHGSKPGGR